MNCTRPVPLTPDQVRAARWLEHHLQTDPEFLTLFLSAAETDWSPVVRFVHWALSRGLLQSPCCRKTDPDAGVPPPHPRQRARVPSGHPQISEAEKGGCVRPGTVPPAVRNRAADADACPEREVQL
jgi:hypothetical protein